MLNGHRDKLTTAAYSTDLKMLASGSEDKTVRLWNVSKQQFKATNNYTPPNEVSFSSDSQIIASITNLNEAELWKQDGTLLSNLPGNNSNITFNSKNDKIATSSQDSIVQYWQSDDSPIKALKGTSFYSEDGNFIALIKDDATVEILNNKGKIITTLKGHKDKIFNVIFSPDNKTIITESRDKTIKLWQINGKLSASLERKKITDEKKENTIIFSSDSNYLVWLYDENTIKFLRSDGKIIKKNEYEARMSITTNPDKNIVAIAKKPHHHLNKIDLWQMDGTFIKTLKFKDTDLSSYFSGFTSDNHLVVKSRISEKTQFWNFDETLVSSIDKEISSFSPDFNIFTTIEGNNKVNLWKRDGTLISSIKVENEKANLQNDFYTSIGGLIIHSGVGEILFSSNNNILAIRTDENTVEIWKSDGNFLGNIQGNANKNIDRFNYGDYGSEHSPSSLPMSFSSDSKNFAIRTGKNEVKIWKIENNKLSLLETVKGKGDLINDIKFIPNSNKLAIIGVDDTVKLWQLPNKHKEKPQLLKTFPGHSNLIKSISFSPNSDLIASASYDKTVKLWQPNGRLYQNFTAHKNKVNSVSFSPNGKLIASASDDKTVKVWQPDGKVIKNFEEHGNAVTHVSFSPDNKLIASASKDNTIKIWSPQSEEVKTLPSDEPVTSISFSPDGKIIATANTKNIKLWSVDGTPLTTYERLGSGSVSFSPDGKSIAAASYQGIEVWDFDLDKLIKRGCDWARDYLKNNPNAESNRTICDDIK